MTPPLDSKQVHYRHNPAPATPKAALPNLHLTAGRNTSYRRVISYGRTSVIRLWECAHLRQFAPGERELIVVRHA